MPKDHKRHLLAHLIHDGNWHQVLVFTRTKHGANRLTQQLEGAGITAAAIHGNKSQARACRRCRTSRTISVTALVATEVAARGLDIKELPHVVNYELPNVPEDYVHRIGRTARAGATGCRGVAGVAGRGAAAARHREGSRPRAAGGSDARLSHRRGWCARAADARCGRPAPARGTRRAPRCAAAAVVPRRAAPLGFAAAPRGVAFAA